MELSILQHYWWFLISLLAALLVALMFVQGGQTLLVQIAKNESENKMVLNSIGKKWEITFTTLVVFGGAFFASFSLFYSTSFGGAYWLWMIILFSFIVQAVGYEYMHKEDNFLGKTVYEIFLYINGSVGVFFIGVAVGSMFTGSPFVVGKINITDLLNPTISYWADDLHGLGELSKIPNLCLGAALVFLSRIGGAMYLINNIDDKTLNDRCRKAALVNFIPFLVFFLAFVFIIFLSEGYAVDPSTDMIYMEKYKYLINMYEVWPLGIMFLVGVLLVLFSGFKMLMNQNLRNLFWFEAAGVLLVVLSLFLCLGYNNTSYYPSTADLQSSLTITNSSSSKYTLEAMSYVSILLVFVIYYMVVIWRKLDKRRINENDFEH